MLEITQEQSRLAECAATLARRFPRTFDHTIQQGFFQLVAHLDDQFFCRRSFAHVRRLLLAQYFLKVKVERALRKKDRTERAIFARIFPGAARICVSLAVELRHQAEIFDDSLLLNVIQTFVPGVRRIHSFSWKGGGYLFCYLEVEKVRGGDLSLKELRGLQENIRRYLIRGIPHYCPAVFWPYDYEESYRRLLILQREIQKESEIPQVMIHFKGHAATELEFLVYIVRTSAHVSLEEGLKLLPPSVRYLIHHHSTFDSPLKSEAVVLALQIPHGHFDSMRPINLLSVRRYIVALMEEVLGQFRDYNGGLLDKQEDIFGGFREQFEQEIPGFSLFGEALFYSLKPLESQISLEHGWARLLFSTFSAVMHQAKPFAFEHAPQGVLVVKAQEAAPLQPLIREAEKCAGVIFGYVKCEEMHYFALLDPSTLHTSALQRRLASTAAKGRGKTLHLAFYEGLPPLLNPYYLASDIRCLTLYKALFEGLTRLGPTGKVTLAGAEKVSQSADGLVYTFHLRPNRWSNGERVTADQYAKGWRQNFSLSDHLDPSAFRCIKKGEEIFRGTASPEELGVYARDAETLEVHLAYPVPNLLERLSRPPFFPAFDESKEPKAFNGPYFAARRDEEELILERNPYFWGRESVFFHSLEILNVDDPEEMSTLFQKRRIDWIGSPLSVIPIHSVPLFEKRGQLRKKKSSLVSWIHLNTRHPLLKEPSVRKALSLSLDRQEINRYILSGEPLYSPLPYSLSLTSRTTVYDRALAQKLFAEGKGEGPLSPLTLRIADHPRFEALATYLKEIWGAVLGLEIQIVRADWSAFSRALDRGDFDIAACNEMPYSQDPLDMLERFEAWASPLYREKVSHARVALLREEKERWLQEAEEMLIEEVPVIPISEMTQLYAHHPDLRHYVFDHAGGIDFRWARFGK